MKIVKVLMSIMLIIGLIVSNNITVYAFYSYETDNISIEEASKQPKYWGQGVCPADNGTTLASGKSIGRAACGYFAASFALVKGGVMNPENDNPVKLIKWVNEKPGERTDSGNWHLNFKSLEKRYKGVTVDAYNYEPKDLRGDDLILWCKGKMEDGWFVVLDTHRTDDGGGHYVCVDGFTDDGDMVIADSAYYKENKPKKWKDEGNYGSHGKYSSSSVSISYAMLIKCEGVDPISSPSIYGDDFKSSSKKLSKEEKDKYNKLVSEFELKGMPDNAGIIVEHQNDVNLVDSSGLSVCQVNNIEQIKDNIGIRHMNIINIMMSFSIFLGLLLCVYSVLLFAGALVDLSNNWIDISIIEKLTLGKCKVVADVEIEGYTKKSKNGVYSWKQWNIRCCIVLLVGLVLVSGLLFKLLLSLLYKLS